MATAHPNEDHRLVIVSNRLPVVLERTSDGRWNFRPGSGGLVTALAPVLRNRGGMWIGWPGVVDEKPEQIREALAEATTGAGYSLRPVLLSADEYDKYYRGFANEVIWPLFHDLQSHCTFDPKYWIAYETVNRKFAEVIADSCSPDDFLWVHDYQLMGVATALRALDIGNRCAFFLHVPFPPIDIFLKLPWRFQVLNQLLEYDLIGFQTQRDRKNFVQCVRALAKDVPLVTRRQTTFFRPQNREVMAAAFPISIDFGEFARLAESHEVADTAWYIHEDLPHRQIILGIDRLDYTKGIPQKLHAFRAALRRYPELHEKIVLLQVVVPSRWNIPRYLDLKTEIDRLVGEINGEFTRSGWVPVIYIYRHLERRELLAYYRTAEVVLITPLKDGMNLVAKEFCASNVEENGVLILSEFAGAAAQLHGPALVVNPHDEETVAQAIHDAVYMPAEERRQRMTKLRQIIRRRDVFWWVNAFLRAAIGKHLDRFPVVEDYMPSERRPPPEQPGAEA
ncbi:MAG: trehalose-6-phosphate synthase [Candidatus Eisenbacteria sp.]|nr:trehalose-6-phosphate synthase [Candidatus Eisenbacteria bacterium]